MELKPSSWTDIVFEERDGGITFRIPPVGIWRAGGRGAFGLGTFMGFALFTGAFAALVTAAAVVGAVATLPQNMEVPQLSGWNGFFGLLFCWSIPAGFLVLARHIGNTTTVLGVQDGKLVIDHTGPLRIKRLEFGREEIREIKRAVASEAPTSEGRAPAVQVLLIAVKKSKPKRFGIVQEIPYQERELLAGRRPEELDWIAAELKRALNLPPAKPMTFWRWLKRDCAE
jgi:hypothetical protein